MLTDGGIVASCEGRAVLKDNTISVQKVLRIAGDVNYKTGHVRFPGDIVISGEVRDGFRIEAGGSLFCEKTLDASEVSCGDNLAVAFGIIGRQKGTVRAGGAIRARFIENCHVEAAGPISVGTAILNSIVSTQDRLEMGPRGIIVGGRILAANGVVTTQVGSERGARTEINIGLDFAVMQKLEWIRDRNVELAVKLTRVQERIKAGGDTAPRLAGARDQIKEAIGRLNTAARELVFHLHKNGEACLVVRGPVLPGTYIEICHISYIVNRPLRSVRFTLDKGTGKIVAQGLAARRQ